MCGRYALTATPEEVQALFGYLDGEDFPPRYNIAPTQPVAIVRLDRGARRLALVRGLLKNAKVTILDDIATGLSDEDRTLRQSIRSVLEGRTLLFGTPNEEVAAEFDHTVTLDQGRIASKGNQGA